MKYVDDVEFWFDPAANVIQVRSASRVGRGDLGVTVKRIEAVRAAYDHRSDGVDRPGRSNGPRPG